MFTENLGSNCPVINENQRLDYLNQLGVVSWMPRQPLPGARPSEYFYHEAPKQESPLARLRPRQEEHGADETVPVSQPSSVSMPSPNKPAIELAKPSETGGQPSADTPVPMDAVAGAEGSNATVNRVPEHLQLVFIRQQGNRPLIVSHFGEHGDSDQLFLPLAQSMLHLVGFSEPLVSMPFSWPLTGMPAVCREQEFVQIFRALLGGARLGCQPNQECWWFGDLPELIAESDGLLNITLHHPASLTQVMTQASEKRQLLYRLLERKQQTTAANRGE